MKFTLYTKPVGQMRARACIRGRHAGTYKAKEQEQREQSLAALLAEHRPPTPLEGPILLYVNCHFAIPSSKSKAWRQEALRGIVRPTTKPDADNLAKHLKDVMTQVGFWHDDKQVVELVVRKWYSLQARWDVEVKRAEVAPVLWLGNARPEVAA